VGVREVIAFAMRYWRWIAGAALILTAVVGIKVWARSLYQDGYDAAMAEVAVESAKQREADIKRNQEQQREWQSDLDALNQRSLSIESPVIRLHIESPSMPAPDPVAGANDASPGQGSILQNAGRDIGPALHAFATDCERFRRQLKQAQRDAGVE